MLYAQIQQVTQKIHCSHLEKIVEHCEKCLLKAILEITEHRFTNILFYLSIYLHLLRQAFYKHYTIDYWS